MPIDERDIATLERLLQMIYSTLVKMNEQLQSIERAIYESRTRE